MDINIKSKYNIGDDIYFAEFYDGWVPSQQYKISEICVTISSCGAIVMYIISKCSNYMRITEDRCFGNYADCLKWCEDHNKSSSSLSIDNTK